MRFWIKIWIKTTGKYLETLSVKSFSIHVTDTIITFCYASSDHVRAEPGFSQGGGGWGGR